MAERLTDLKKKEIIAYYIECQNYSEVARKFNINASTVMRIVQKQDNEEMQRKAKEKKEENTKSVLEAMDERREKKISILNKILDAIETKADNLDMFTNIKDLATAYGIIMDKEIKAKEMSIKSKESSNGNGVTRVQIINDLPKDDDIDG